MLPIRRWVVMMLVGLVVLAGIAGCHAIHMDSTESGVFSEKFSQIEYDGKVGEIDPNYYIRGIEDANALMSYTLAHASMSASYKKDLQKMQDSILKLLEIQKTQKLKNPKSAYTEVQTLMKRIRAGLADSNSTN